MAYEFQVLGWRDFAGNDPYDEAPTQADLPNVAGVFVHYWDDETGDDSYEWVMHDEPYEHWQDWYDAIADSLADYGLEVA